MAVTTSDVLTLPNFPSSEAIRRLPPSLQSKILTEISTALLAALALPADQFARSQLSDFVASYARDNACERLSSLVHGDENENNATTQRYLNDRIIRKRVLLLADRLATVPKAGGLNLQSLLDIAVVFGPKNAARVKTLFSAAFKSNPTLLTDLLSSAIPSFSRLLTRVESGLHALRKTTYCLSAFLNSAPPEVVELFAKDKDFVLSIARCYDIRLTSIAMSYGGISVERGDETGEATMFIGCKVALVDCFHIMLQSLLQGIRADPRQYVEYTLDLILALVELPSSSTQPSATPFLNQPLVADYQQAYSLSATLASVFANSTDARLGQLERTLRSFDEEVQGRSDRTGALKLLLKSIGAAPGLQVRASSWTSTGKGKAVAPPEPSESDLDLDLAISSVLELFPDQSPEYIRALLLLPSYNKDAEQVINALLTGEAPLPESLPPPSQAGAGGASRRDAASKETLVERRNIFDDEVIDPAKVTLGKRRDDTDAVLKDRTFMDRMKADILRRAEEQSDSDSDAEPAVDAHGRRILTAAFEEELDDDDAPPVRVERIKLAVDGEDSASSTDEESEEVAEPAKQDPETILELAYLRDPALFDRSAHTRRSAPRAALRTQTGWGDEQIEGWRVMLERNPRKDKILQKHEFAGNRPAPAPAVDTQPSGSGASGASGTGAPRGRGRGRGTRGGGRGGGGPRGGGGGAGGGTADRAWKGKNKARQGNHDRKRGHDKKMARGGAHPPPE